MGNVRKKKKKSLQRCRNRCKKKEPGSTFHNYCRNEKKKVRNVRCRVFNTLGNFSCNSSHNKIAKQLARNVA